MLSFCIYLKIDFWGIKRKRENMFAKFSVKKPYTVLVAVVMVIILGVVSLTKMTADLLPNINLPYVIIMTPYVGASPETVEMAVTKPVEASMATVSNIESISSVSNVRERDGQVLVQVQGVSSKNQSVYYKVEWFDYNFINISSGLSRWKRANLRENMDFLWKMVAPSKRAVSYKIYITQDIGDGLLD